MINFLIGIIGHCTDQRNLLHIVSDFRFLFEIQAILPEISPFLSTPSITDGVHRNENFVEIIPVVSTFSNFFKKEKKI